jgi:hypothetical protein
MDNYSELALSSLDWLYAKPSLLLVLLAAMPLVWLVIQFRVISLLAIGVIAGAIALLQHGIEALTAALLVISLSGLLTVIDASLTRRRLKRLENSLASTTQAVRELEVAEERWQGFAARQQQFPGSNASLHGKDAPAPAGADEPSALKASENLPNIRSFRSTGS